MDSLGHLEQGAHMTALDHVFRATANCCMSAAGLAIGTSKPKVLITNTVKYLVGGFFCSKTTAEIAFTATTHDIAPSLTVAQAAWYALTLDKDGTATITKGASARTTLATLPEIPTTGTLIGAVKVVVAVGATGFDASTDNLDASHLTTTYVDLGFVSPMYGAEATCTGFLA